MFSDNTPTVAWANKLSTSSSSIASYLLRALAMRLHMHKANTLTVHEAGVTNTMVDVTSRSSCLKAYTSNSTTFLTQFQSQFPLTQDLCGWKEFHLPLKWLSLVMSCLRGKPSPLEQWIRLPNEDKNIGKTGISTAASGVTHPSSQPTTPSSVVSLQQYSLLGPGQATLATERQSKLAVSRKRSAPSPRPASWLDNQARSTKHTRFTSCQWHGWWRRVCKELTHLLYHN